MNTKSLSLLTAVLLLLAGSFTTVMAQSGHVLNGVGPIDQAMAGAGMAAPQDALVPVHWNPAAIAMSKESSLDVSLQFLQPTGSIASSVDAGAFGPLGPNANLLGSTDSNAGPFPIPSLGYVRVMPDSRLTFGLGAMFVGGFGVDYDASGFAASQPNPILTPQSGTGQGLGFGAIESSFALLQVNPTVAYKLSDRVSIGLAPTVDYALLKVTPFPAATPVPLDPSNPQSAVYPDGPQTGALGFGFQLGVHAQTESGFSAGLSFKSPQWFQDFEFESADIVAGSKFAFNLDYPMIVSAGVAYTGVEKLLVAADVRYIDFENTDGFSEVGYNEFGVVQGFGWKSIVVAAVGVQYEVADGFPVRLGYSYNQSPISHENAFFNTPSPAIIEHHLAGGLGVQVTDRVQANVALQYGLENSCEGNWVLPASFGGTNPMTTVTSDLSTLTFILGARITL